MTAIDRPAKSDERLMAALCYFLGLLAGFIVWLLYKDKSRFVSFHAVQAMAVSIFMVVVSIFLSTCLSSLLVVGFMVAGMFALENSPKAMLFLPALFSMLIFLAASPVVIFAWAIRLWGTIGVLVKSDFRYPVLGRWVENFLKE